MATTKTEDNSLVAAASPASDAILANNADVESQKLRRKKLLRLAGLVILIVIIHAAAMVALDLTLFKIRRPNYKLTTVAISNLVVNNSTSSPSFLMDLNAEIHFRNRNFGPYEYESGYLTFSYRGVRVGEAGVERGRVKMYSSRGVDVTVRVDSRPVGERSRLRRDIGGGAVVLRVESELRGQVGLMRVIKKDRVVKLNCSFMVDLSLKLVYELSC